MRTCGQIQLYYTNIENVTLCPNRTQNQIEGKSGGANSLQWRNTSEKYADQYKLRINFNLSTIITDDDFYQCFIFTRRKRK